MDRPLDLASPVVALRGIGPARADRLAEVGCRTLGDLLLHLPHRYEDRSRIVTLAEALVLGKEHPGRSVSMIGRLSKVKSIPVRRRGFSLVRGRFDDGSGEIGVLWFNRPYLAKRIDPERDYLLHGPLRAARGGKKLELTNPSCEPAATALHGGRVVPIYSALGDLGPAALRRIIGDALRSLDPTAISDPLPEEVRRRYALPALGEALIELHRPSEGADPEALNDRSGPAHGRLIYGELLSLQLELAALRAERHLETKPHRYRIDDRVRNSARRLLPFRLTNAQKRAVRQIADDLRRPEPMVRLLQGDVGSGKTIVAVLALLLALESGLQGAFMAPTELLAEQHGRSLARRLGERFRIGLLTASNPDLATVREELSAGRIDLAVGTHALIQDSVAMPHLGLAVIDEQHRFGVDQRQRLEAKGVRPDLLVMTATPIPRSLALTVYGDLDLSVIDELPPGRSPIETVAVRKSDRKTVYRELTEALADGARAYVVMPLIEDSEMIDAASIEVEGRQVLDWLRGVSTAVLHGRVTAEEREEIMAGFGRGDIQVLVATTVIEVGVDVPEATQMIIESAERFGLSQLHQLRGRVGRGAASSRCVAIHGRLTEEGRRRLEVFTATTDGFEIAEADLEIRGPGDLLGTRQAGLPTFRVSNLVSDRRWLERARADAQELFPRLRRPELARLKRRIDRRVARRKSAWAGA